MNSACLKVNVSIMGCRPNTRNNYADRIWFHIKQQITKGSSKSIICISEIIYVITNVSLQYIAGHKVLLNKSFTHHKNVATNPLRTQ